MVRDNGMRMVSEQLPLRGKLQAAVEPTPDLMAEILDLSRRRALIPGHGAAALHLEQCMDAGAWIDAALALLEMELPLWQIRRIAYDGGEWYCALSRQRELPDWLDQSLEARHSDLALAILGAFVEAQAAAVSMASTREPSGKPDTDFIWLCCDNNFA